MTQTLGTGLSFWTESDNDWDTLILGGEVWPGIPRIRGRGVGRKLDVKKTKGADIGTVKDEGYKNGRLTISLTIWTSTQWRELQRLLVLIHPRRKGGERRPLDIIHPMANLLGVTTVYVETIPFPDVDFERGGPMVFSFDAIEWTEAPKPVKKASGTGGLAAQQPATSDNLGPVESAIQAVETGLANAGETFADAVNDLADFF